jgi:hypothetical protein
VQAIAASGPIRAVAAPRAKPATFQTGWSAVGRTPRVETGAVAGFLVGHRGDVGGVAGAIAHDRELARVDPRRAVFAGLVDA